MLPEIGASELMVIAAVALIVVGPKDLPALMRKVGKVMTHMRGMAAEFRNSFDEMARESELDDLRREVEALRTGTTINPVSADIDQSFRNLDDDMRSKPQMTRLDAGATPLTQSAEANAETSLVTVEPEQEPVREARG